MNKAEVKRGLAITGLILALLSLAFPYPLLLAAVVCLALAMVL